MTANSYEDENVQELCEGKNVVNIFSELGKSKILLRRNGHRLHNNFRVVQKLAIERVRDTRTQIQILSFPFKSSNRPYL